MRPPPVTRGGSMPSIRFPRAIGNLLLFLLSTPHSRPPRVPLSLAVSLGLMHITCRAHSRLQFAHTPGCVPLLGSPGRRRTTLAGPTTLLGDGDTPSCQRRRIIGAVHLAQRSGKKKGCARPRDERAPLTSLDPAAKTRASCSR